MNAIDNEVLQCIRGRRSTRRFTEQNVPPEQLNALLDAATWAPSGSNSQSWLFTAIQNRETLSRLNRIARAAFQTWIPDEDYPAKQKIKERSQENSYSFFYNAPALIIASNRPRYENAMADCALALENIFLAAHSLGLATCYINQLHWLRNDDAVRDFLATLGIPREHTICSSAAIGFAAAPVPVPARKSGTVNIVN